MCPVPLPQAGVLRQEAGTHCCKENLPVPTEPLQDYFVYPKMVKLRDHELYQQAEGMHTGN